MTNHPNNEAARLWTSMLLFRILFVERLKAHRSTDSPYCGTPTCLVVQIIGRLLAFPFVMPGQANSFVSQGDMEHDENSRPASQLIAGFGSPQTPSGPPGARQSGFRQSSRSHPHTIPVPVHG